MFTGIVQALGTVREFQPLGSSVRLEIAAPEIAENMVEGDSVAVNGCCLTVVSLARRSMRFDVGPETLARTNLGRLTSGDKVNLEPSLSARDPLGGHFVLGHIDGTVTLADRRRDGEFEFVSFDVPPTLSAEMVPKGSVAVDGVSLTLIDVQATRFSVMLIPHTLTHTTLGLRRVGEPVNIETDILGKYVLRYLRELRPF